MIGCWSSDLTYGVNGRQLPTRTLDFDPTKGELRLLPKILGHDEDAKNQHLNDELLQPVHTWNVREDLLAFAVEEHDEECAPLVPSLMLKVEMRMRCM